MIGSRCLRFAKTATLLQGLVLIVGVPPLACQTQTEQQFIASVNATISSLSGSFGTPAHPVVFSGNLVYANGGVVANTTITQNVLQNYVEGLKAAGAQRVDLNPGVTTINDPIATARYDAIVEHIRELGLQLAINPEVTTGELGTSPTFQDFQQMAMKTYPELAARYQPDNFVIVHEPTTMDARMGIQPSPQDWDGFIRAVAPLIKAASPHTRLGAGGFYNDAENTFFQDFVTIPVLDFMTMDVYADDKFPELTGWVQLAHANGKGIYVEETWAPKYLPNPLPPGWQSNPGGLDALALVGVCNADFAQMDVNWLQLMSKFASANDMEALTPFTTEAFFALGTAGADKPFNATYLAATQQALLAGQLTSTGQAYLADNKQYGIKEAVSISSASYATVSSKFSASGFANSTVAPDELVSAFGADLGTKAEVTPSSNYPTNLGGTTITLVDSSNTSYDVQMYFASPLQVNYMVPTNVKPGPAIITVKSADGTVTTGVIVVKPVAPGLYTGNGNGKGPAAAIAVTGHADGTQSFQDTFTCGTPGNCVTQPIDLGASTDTVVVELFATGLRHLTSLSAISVQINGQTAKVLYAGMQPQYPGLDQINVEIPRSLAGAGEVNVVVTVEDTVDNTTTTCNTVTIHIK